MAAPTPDRATSLRQALVVLLTVNAGATDAIGFLALGGAFTSVMTGNLVLFGISVAEGDGSLAGHILAAVLSYIAGCGLGGWLAGSAVEHQPVWPRSVSYALCAELALFACCAVGWWLAGSAPSGAAQLTLLAANALALGVQSSSVQRFGVSGLSTTYMTGTLTTLVVRLVAGHGLRKVAGSLQNLIGLVTGAVIAAALVDHAPVLAPLVQVVSLAVVLAGSLLVMRAEPVEPAGQPSADAAAPVSPPGR